MLLQVLIKFSPPSNDIVLILFSALKKVPLMDTHSSFYDRPISGNFSYVIQRKLDKMKTKSLKIL